MINLRDLQSFVAVIEEGSFSKAARKLKLSQPTISAHLSSLEKELSVQLVVRSTKSSKPTEAGMLLYDYAKKIFSLLQEAEISLNTFPENGSNTLRIAVSTVPALYFLPESLPQLQKAFPNLSYEIIETDSMGAATAVYEHKADLAIVGTCINYEGLRFTSIAEENLLLVAAPKEPYISAIGKVNRDNLLNWPFIRREDGSGTWRESYNFFKSYDLNTEDLNTVAQVNGTRMAIQSVRSGLGYALISERAVQPYIDSGQLIDLQMSSPDLKRYFWLVTPKNRLSTPALKYFTELIKEKHENSNETIYFD